MLKLEKVNLKEEFSIENIVLNEFLLDQDIFYLKLIEKNLDKFETGEKEILSIKDDGYLLGYFTIQNCDFSTVKINGIYIFEDEVSKEITKISMDELSNYLKSKDKNILFIQTNLDEDKALNFFDSNGYTLIGTNSNPIEEKENYVAYKNLNENNLDAKELAGNIYNNFSQKNEAKVLRKRKK